MRGKEMLWRKIRTLWTVLLLAVLFVGAVQVKAEKNQKEGTGQQEVQTPTITVTQYIDGEEYTGQYLPLDIDSEHTLSVKVVVSDGSKPTYEWTDNDGNTIENEDSDTLTIKKGIGYEYYNVIVITENGEPVPCSFSLCPEETLQVTQWIGEEETSYTSCQPGESVTFTMKAESTYEQAHITYQWYDNSDNPIEGATDSQYTIEKQNNGLENYSCKVDDGNYSIWYSFTVDMGETLSYTLQINGQDYTEWTDYTCTEDDTYTLSVNAKTMVPDGNIAYQWYEMSDNGSISLEEEKTSTLIVDKPTGYKQYYCEIFDGNRRKPVYFNLNLGDTLSVKQYVDGDLYRKYMTLECAENESVQLEMRAESSLGAEKITYDWYYYNAKNEYTSIGDDSAICNFPMQAGYYQIYCTVTDGNENETYYFYLTTAPTLSVEQYMNGNKGTNTDWFVNGDPIKLEVKASTTSGNNITYQWYNSTWCDESTKLPEEKDAVLNVTKGEAANNEYCCKVSDGIFTEECRFYIYSKNTLLVRGFINDSSADANLSFTEGEKVTLRVEATSSYDNDNITYEWFRQVDGERIKLETERPMVCNVTKGNGTEYYECEADDGNAKFIYGFELHEDTEGTSVTCIPYIDGERYNSYNAEKYNCAVGQSLTLRAEVLTEEDNISRVWEYYDDNQGEWVKQGEKGESISVKVASEFDKYRCTITVDEEKYTLYYDLYARSTGGGDEPGEEEYTYVVLYVNGKESSEITDSIGKTVNLSVDVVNPPENVTYQWYKDRGNSEIAIKGATEDSCAYTIEEGVESISCIVYINGNSAFYTTFYIADAYEEEEEESTLTFTQYINNTENGYIKYTPGEEVTLKVEAQSSTGSSISYTWYNEDEVQIGTGTTYQFEPVGYQEIYCQMFDGVSYKNAWFELDMQSTWSATQHIDGVEAEEKVCVPNSSVRLEMKVTGEPAGTLTYKWLNDRNKLQGTESFLSVTASEKAEVYRCIVSDGYQTEEYEFYLRPEGSISFDIVSYIGTEQTDEIYLNPGEDTELKVDVSGTTEGITYQWYIFRGEGAYSPLGTSAVQKVTAGEYEGNYYLCVVRVGSVERTVYFHVYVNNDSGEHVHQWDDGAITKQPTQTETGIKTYTCLTCGETKEEILDKLPPATEDTKPTEPSNPTTQTKPTTQTEPTTQTKPTTQTEPTTQTKPATQPSDQTPQNSPSAQTPVASPAPAIGATLVSSDKRTTYKVTGNNTVEYEKTASSKAKVTIPSTVTYGGQTYQVTSVAAKAFRNNKKLKKVVIPSTVRKIGKQAFINCKKLKSITIKTNKLTAKSVGSKAFKGINPKATIKVPKKKLKLYRKILRMKGVSGSMKIK